MNGLVHRPTAVPMQRRVGSANICCYRAGGYRVGHRFAVRRRARPMANGSQYTVVRDFADDGAGAPGRSEK